MMQINGTLGVCRNSILGVFGIFLAKKLFKCSKFSDGIFLTWHLFSHFVKVLENKVRLAGQPDFFYSRFLSWNIFSVVVFFSFSLVVVFPCRRHGHQ